MRWNDLVRVPSIARAKLEWNYNYEYPSALAGRMHISVTTNQPTELWILLTLIV